MAGSSLARHVFPRGVTFRRPGGNIEGVHPITQAAASAGTGDAGPAVAVVLGVIAVWWLATHGKGGAGFRLIAWILLPLVFWMLLAVHDPAQAGRIASGAASGVATAVSGISQWVSGI